MVAKQLLAHCIMDWLQLATQKRVHLLCPARYIMSKVNILMYSEIEMITEGPGIRVV